MAEGVAKSFRSNFLEKLTDAMDEQSGGMRNAEMVKAALEEVEKATGEQPRLGSSVSFDEKLAKKFPRDVIARVRKRAEEATERDTYQAMEGFVHNLNTMQSRAGSQVVFSSVNYGTDTSPEGRMVIRNLLLALEAGLGHGETCIFPIHIFKVKEGVNYNEDDPNYDLFKLSCRVSAKRLFPNYVFLDSPYNLQYYKPGHPETEVATMGAVTGNDIITLKLDNRQEITLPFKTAYERYSKQHVKIADRGNFVKVLKWHKYEDAGDWYRVTFSDGKKIQMTSDHPLPTQRGRIECKDLRIGDWVPLADLSGVIEITKIEFLGYSGEERYDVTTSSDRFDVSGINSHNCRTRVMGNVHDRTKEIAYSRGNLSFTTINLPRLGIESRGDEKLFYEKLDGMLEMVAQQLLDRFEIQASKHVYNFPFLMGQGVWLDSDKLRNDDEIREVLKHGTLSIGFIGLAETLTALYGHHHGESEEMQKKGLEIISHMREFCDRKSQECKMNFTLLATPAEGLSGRFIRMDKERYGSLPGVTDREYYTNSFHIPVWFPITAYEKIKLEAPYHALCNAGHISYVELDGDTAKNVEAFESIIRWMHDCQIGYGSINHPVDRDPVCGFVGVINDTCPRCGRKDGEAVSDEMLEQLKKHYPYLPIFRGIE